MKSSIRDKIFLVSGYGITPHGYTRGARIEVAAPDTAQAKSLATARLRWEGLTAFRAVTVCEVFALSDKQK